MKKRGKPTQPSVAYGDNTYAHKKEVPDKFQQRKNRMSFFLVNGDRAEAVGCLHQSNQDYSNDTTDKMCENKKIK